MAQMLYFFRAGPCIKIGRGQIMKRFSAAKTFSPFPPEIVMAIDVPNEAAAEKALHLHFSKHRTHGEWFEINLTSAVKALLDLRLIPENPQPLLEVPVQVEPPGMDPDFPRWFIATRDPVFWSPEDIEYAKANIESHWRNDHDGQRERFLRLKREHSDLDKMIEEGRPLTNDEVSTLVAEQLKLLRAGNNEE